MKLVIDIPEKVYKCVMDGTYCGSLYEGLKNGVPVDTSGDCVSRKELLKKFTYDYKGEKIPEVDCDNFPTQISFKDVKKWIRELPSVEPEKCGDYIEKQKAISELQPPTDDWENYADRLYDLAYLSGYNDGLIAKEVNNTDGDNKRN